MSLIGKENQFYSYHIMSIDGCTHVEQKKNEMLATYVEDNTL